MHVVMVRLGLRENLGQFSLLVLVNALVGATIGLERSIIPEIAAKEFLVEAKTAILSFIIVFGVAKAITNYLAGALSESWGRKQVLVLGWLVGLPVPFLLIYANSWAWVLFANLLLGISQGLAWSTTVIMKIDLVGPKQRGLAMGLNEFAGYLALASSALLTGFLASRYGLRPVPFYVGIAYVVLGLLLSAILVRETKGHAAEEARGAGALPSAPQDIFLRTTLLDRNLSSITQAGLVNNLNDGMAWGLFPILFALHGLSLERIGWLAAIYPGVWGACQIYTGHLSDRAGRKWLIVGGMWVQASGIGLTAFSSAFPGFVAGAVLLGMGTAMVYPTLLAGISDVAHPSWRARSVGVYRFWRDLGYSIGALVAGVAADLFGVVSAIWIVAAITFLSGVVVQIRMRESVCR